MAGANVKEAREVNAHPFLVIVPTGALKTYLDSLVAASGASGSGNDLAQDPLSHLLWAARVLNAGSVGAEAGSAYVVSSETYKRILAQRY